MIGIIFVESDWFKTLSLDQLLWSWEVIFWMFNFGSYATFGAWGVSSAEIM